VKSVTGVSQQNFTGLTSKALARIRQFSIETQHQAAEFRSDGFDCIPGENPPASSLEEHFSLMGDMILSLFQCVLNAPAGSVLHHEASLQRVQKWTL